jgi:RND family efflux transporter MFP subunit
MSENQIIRKDFSKFKTAVISIFLTLFVVGAVLYSTGYSVQRTIIQTEQPGDSGKDQARKVAYWKAPMNPTEIYDAPGKSAMGMDLVPVYKDELDSDGPSKTRKIVYWRAPMNPTEIYNAPGKSAMDMDLIPVYEDELIGGVEVKVDPVIQQNMGIRTAVVKKGPLNNTIRSYAHITYDETKTAVVSPKVSGWIEKINVDFTGKFARKDEPLFELYSPDLFAAQEEYLITYQNLSSMSNKANNSLLKSARMRLKYFDIADDEILAIERAGKIQKNITIRSPVDGVVILKNAVKGSFIKAGTTIYRIADLSTVWVEIHIFEYELPWVSEGQSAIMTLPYLPGRKFEGRVTYVYPYLQRETRDVVVRLEYKNPTLELKPEMYADVEIRGMGGEGLSVPSEAVIRSGRRNIIFVDQENGKFTPRDVTLGLSLDNQRVQILTGLVEGEKIVTSGQFLLDSESKLKEAVQKMLAVKIEREKTREPQAEDEEDMEAENFFKDMEDEESDDDFFKNMESD